MHHKIPDKEHNSVSLLQKRRASAIYEEHFDISECAEEAIEHEFLVIASAYIRFKPMINLRRGSILRLRHSNLKEVVFISCWTRRFIAQAST